MRKWFRQTAFSSLLSALSIGFCQLSSAQEQSGVTLFENVRIFDGKSAGLIAELAGNFKIIMKYGNIYKNTLAH